MPLHRRTLPVLLSAGAVLLSWAAPPGAWAQAWQTWIHSGGSVTRINTASIDSMTFVFADTTRPQVPVLTATGVGTNSIRIDWTAVLDPRQDGSTGPATSYDLRWSANPSTPFASMTPAAGLPIPAAPGNPESFTVDGLGAGALFYFVLAVMDSLGNTSYSAPVSGNTLHPGPRGVVIAEIYTGGGFPGATYTHDYVVLFNNQSTPQSLSGLSLQRASQSSATWTSLNLSGSIAPHGYFLIQLASDGANGVALPTPDLTGSLNMIGSMKLQLKLSTSVDSGTCPLFAGYFDFVAWGSPNCYEIAPATAPGLATEALVRLNGGCLDTDNNSTDFTSGVPNPRNSASPPTVCP